MVCGLAAIDNLPHWHYPPHGLVNSSGPGDVVRQKGMMRGRRSGIFLIFGIFLVLTAAYTSYSAAPATGKSRGSTASPRAIIDNAPQPRIHVVRQGDSLYSIARSDDISIATLKKINHLTTNRLRIGQKIQLPMAEAASIPAVQPPNASSVSARPEVRSKRPPDLRETDGDTNGEPEYMENWNPPDEETPEGSAGAPSDASTQPLRIRLASMGMGFLGVRYRWTGMSEKIGFDCSGMVKTLFEKFNISLPRSSREQYKVGEKVDKRDLEIGDLVFFSSHGKTPTHVGVYLGNDKFLHAARKARRVLISSLSAPWYTKRFLGARRLMDLWAEEPAPADAKTR